MKPVVLWITDPWESLDHESDTTLRLLEESMDFGYINYWANYLTIKYLSKSVYINAKKVDQVYTQRSATSFIFSAEEELPISNFNIIHYRVDPPINDSYRYHLQLLVLGKQLTNFDSFHKLNIINSPSELLLSSEKFGQASIGNLYPDSFISSQWNMLLDFGIKKSKTVLKPLNNAQNKGVELLRWQSQEDCDFAFHYLYEATKAFTTPVLLQQFLEDVKNGEIRMWFVDGNLIGKVRKMTKRDDFRINMDKGDIIIPVDLNGEERQSVKLISEYLKGRGIFLAAVDMIENRITDFNITSPGLIVQMEKVLNINLAKEVALGSARLIGS